MGPVFYFSQVALKGWTLKCYLFKLAMKKFIFKSGTYNEPQSTHRPAWTFKKLSRSCLTYLQSFFGRSVKSKFQVPNILLIDTSLC